MSVSYASGAANAPGHRRRVSGDVIILVALLLLFAVLSFYIAGQGKQGDLSTALRRSSLNAEPGGWKAIYEVLRRRGDRVERWERRPDEWPAGAGVVITGPHGLGGISSLWDRGEARSALKWVDAGGTLIAFTDADDPLTRAIGVSTTYTEDDAELEGTKVKATGSGKDKDDSSEEEDDDRPETVPVAPGKAGTPLQVRQPAAFLQGVGSLVSPGEKRYTSIPVDAVSLVADARPLVVAVRHGAGWIVTVSDAGVIDNAHLADGDNARFGVQLAEAFAAAPKRTRILFDEYHQGYQQSESLWIAIGHPGQLAFWQLLVLALLVVYSSSRRFGQPQPVPAPPRLSSEYIASLAGLYRRAHATQAALEGIYRPFWRDLCRAAALPQDADLRTVAAGAVAAAPERTSNSHRAELVERIVRVVAECRAKIEAGGAPPPPADGKTAGRRRPRNTLSEYDMLRLTLDVEALRKELELGRREEQRVGS